MKKQGVTVCVSCERTDRRFPGPEALVLITHQENCMTMSMMEIEQALKQLRLSGVRAK